VRLHELFDRQASATPQATALTFEDDTQHKTHLSFSELQRAANQVAALLQSMGYGKTCRRIALQSVTRSCGAGT
jgi:acyl-coenzyme A synthetase/AMP-(fatty) acid ligase